MNRTPSSERIHIGVFGKRNAGKSSLVNAITGQNLSVVSDVKGTTTDPVLKSMELLPLGPVVVMDTPGLDDEGELGTLRIEKTYQILQKTDIALLIVDGCVGITCEDEKILQEIRKVNIPYITVYNKRDLCENQTRETTENSIAVSAVTGEQIERLKEMIAHAIPQEPVEKRLIGDLLRPLDFVVLVIPIDASAPKGRLILPQQQTIRDILEAGAVPIVVRDTELLDTLDKLKETPACVITDSQAFGKVSQIVPKEIPLTSFSILMARYKGDLRTVVRGAEVLEQLRDGDRILISEGCTHHRQCEDIGTVKLPKWIREYTGKELSFSFTSGTEFPKDLSQYQLVIHCGGCMLNEREMKSRIACAEDARIPITNYGTVIAYMKGILQRSIEMFGEIG